MHKLDESLGFPRVYKVNEADVWSGDLAAVLTEARKVQQPFVYCGTLKDIDFTSRILWELEDDLRNFVKDFIIKVQTMSNLPTLSVFGTVSDVVDDLFGVLEQKLEASGTFALLPHYEISDEGKMDLGDFPPM